MTGRALGSTSQKSVEANSPSQRTAIIVSLPLPVSMAGRTASPSCVLTTYTDGEAFA